MRLKTILSVSIFALLFCVLGSGAALAEEEDSWAFSEEIIIQENSGSELRAYPVLVKLTASNFNFSKASPEGADLRFFKSGKKLDYWIKEWNSEAEEAEIWVEIPFLAAKENTTILMKFGNPDVKSESDGEAVFDFFEAFEENSLDGFKWKSEASGEGFVEVRNGVCRLVAPKVHVNDFSTIYTKDSFDINSIFEVRRMKVTTGEDTRGPLHRQGFVDQQKSPKNKVWHETELENESKVRWELSSRNERFRSIDLTDVRVSEGEWYESSVAWYEENETLKVAWFKDGVRVPAMDYSSADFVPSRSLHAFLYTASYPDASKNTGYMAVDYALVRKFVSEEPTIWVGEIPSEAEISRTEPQKPKENSSLLSAEADKNKTENEEAFTGEFAPLSQGFLGIQLRSLKNFELPALTAELKAIGTKVVFLKVEPENIWQYERFLKAAHAENLTVYALLFEDMEYNSSKKIEPSLATLDTVLAYNQKSIAGFDGICIYVKPSENPESEEGYIDYLTLLEAANKKLKGELPLSASLPPRYATSKIRELTPHLDFFVLRAYGEANENLNSKSLIVDSVAPKMGEIRWQGSKGVLEIEIKQGFKDKKEVESLFSALNEYYSGDPAFLGVSVSNYETYSHLPTKAKEEAAPTSKKPSIPGFELSFALIGLGICSLLTKNRK
ncbi:MAG: DUF2341 domain-containing protein [Methanosarcinaceae archaeon]|nr:DUF2341 domain-containing protein [Methanosarcinaceae archaeon]